MDGMAKTKELNYEISEKKDILATLKKKLALKK